MWSDAFDVNALIASHEALQARVLKLEADMDHMLDYIHEQKFIQPEPTGGYVPRNRGVNLG